MTDHDADQPQPLVAHLTELRDRLLRALLAVLLSVPWAFSLCQYDLCLRLRAPEGATA
jgi:Sec-independent protein secretion pathway component TatC